MFIVFLLVWLIFVIRRRLEFLMVNKQDGEFAGMKNLCESDEQRVASTVNVQQALRATKLEFLKARLPPALLGLILYLMDALTIGEKGLVYPGDSSSVLPRLSTLLFILGSCVSQLVFFCFSSFSIGLIASSISESFVAFQGISKDLYDTGLREASHFSTLMACIMISTWLTAIGFGILYWVGAESLMRRLPCEIGISLYFVIGCFCCRFGNDVANLVFAGRWMYLLGYNVFAIGLWAAGRFLAQRVPSLGRYIYLLSLLVLVPLGYLGMWLVGGGLSYYRDIGFLPELPKDGALSSHWVSNSSFRLIDLSVLLKQLPSLLAIAGLNLLHFSVNIPAIQSSTDTRCSIKKELRANAFSNIITGVCGGYPSYLVSSSTIAINTPDRSRKIDMIIVAVLFPVVFFASSSGLLYVPRMCFDLLLMLIGLDILWGSAQEIKQAGWFCAVLTLGVALISLWTEKLQLGMAFALLGVSSRWVYLKASPKRPDTGQEDTLTITTIPL